MKGWLLRYVNPLTHIRARLYLMWVGKGWLFGCVTPITQIRVGKGWRDSGGVQGRRKTGSSDVLIH